MAALSLLPGAPVWAQTDTSAIAERDTVYFSKGHIVTIRSDSARRHLYINACEIFYGTNPAGNGKISYALVNVTFDEYASLADVAAELINSRYLFDEYLSSAMFRNGIEPGTPATETSEADTILMNNSYQVSVATDPSYRQHLLINDENIVYTALIDVKERKFYYLPNVTFQHFYSLKEMGLQLTTYPEILQRYRNMRRRH